MKKLKNMTNNKLVKWGIKIFEILVTIMIICFVLVVYLQKFSDNKLSFFSFRMYTVISGSMEPKYKVGDVLISKEIEPEDIRVGDTITYIGSRGEFRNKLITHNVEKIEKNDDGSYSFYTKGLANAVMDPVVSEEQVYGKTVYKSTILSFIYRTIMKPIGFFLLMVLPIMCMVGFELFKVVLRNEKEKVEG